MTFLTTLSASLLQDTYRMLKVIKMGDADVQEVSESSPFGFDSNPVKGMIAIYAETIDDSEPVIIGYMNPNQLADVGETRLFSTDENGNLKTYLWLKKDGVMLLGGDADNAVRYSELKTGFDQLKSDFNNLVSIFNAHIHPLTTGTASPTVTPGTASDADISGSKIEEIKTS